MSDAGVSRWGIWLRRTRRAHGLRQDDLAAMVGVHTSTIINQEKHGQLPSPEILEKIVQALGANILDALATIYNIGSQQSDDGLELPKELDQLVALYVRLGPRDQGRLLSSVDLINDWARERVTGRS